MTINSENVRTDLLPYDFVRSNEVIVAQEEDKYLIISTKNLSNLIFVKQSKSCKNLGTRKRQKPRLHSSRDSQLAAKCEKSGVDQKLKKE